MMTSDEGQAHHVLEVAWRIVGTLGDDNAYLGAWDTVLFPLDVCSEEDYMSGKVTDEDIRDYLIMWIEEDDPIVGTWPRENLPDDWQVESGVKI